MPNILVIGSINMDMVARIDHIPLQGESVLGEGYSFNPGGKGANSAVAAARLGGKVSFAGCVGRDDYGKALRKVMPKSYILVPGYGAQGGKGADLVHFFNEDGLGAIVNSSRGIIAAYQQEKYAQFGAANYADASRQAVIDMREDIAQALQGRK